MTQNILCITSHDFVMGGVESYFMRMFQWGKENNCNNYLCIEKGSKIDEIWKNALEKNSVQVLEFMSDGFHLLFYNESKISFKFLENDNYVAISSDIHAYTKFLYLKYFNNLKNLNIYFYILHPNSVYASKKRFLNYPYRLLIKHCLDNIFCMDEETAISFEKTYKTTLNFSTNILRLGIEIHEYKGKEVEAKCESKRKSLNILSISRMDFPFKGYNIGLVNDFIKLVKIYPSLKLTIIGNGRNKKDLLKVISSNINVLKGKINILNDVPYEEIISYFVSSHLYIGMGTTLLDASLQGVPCIIAKSYQYGNISPGFFCDEYNNLSGNLEINNSSSKTFFEMIKNIINMSDEDYLNLSKRCYLVVKNHYNIDLVMNTILKSKKREEIKIKKSLLLFDSLLTNIQKFEYRKKR